MLNEGTGFQVGPNGSPDARSPIVEWAARILAPFLAQVLRTSPGHGNRLESQGDLSSTSVAVRPEYRVVADTKS